MAEPSNPYAPPASGPETAPSVDPDALGPVIHTLAASWPDKAGAPWTIALHEGHARFFDDADTRLVVVSRAEFPERVGLATFDQAILTIKPPDKLTLRTPIEHARVIKDWLGDDGRAWMKALLAQRRRFTGITSALFGFVGLVDGNMFLVGYAVVSALLFALARLAPTRHLFLGDAAISVAFGAFFGWQIYTGAMSLWWALFLLVVAISVPLNLRLFAFFGPRAGHS